MYVTLGLNEGVKVSQKDGIFIWKPFKRVCLMRKACLQGPKNILKEINYDNVADKRRNFVDTLWNELNWIIVYHIHICLLALPGQVAGADLRCAALAAGLRGETETGARGAAGWSGVRIPPYKKSYFPHESRISVNMRSKLGRGCLQVCDSL